MRMNPEQQHAMDARPGQLRDADHERKRSFNREQPRKCENCGYPEDQHWSFNCCPDGLPTHGSPLVHHRTTRFSPVPCVDCGEPALGGLICAPRCEWCLAGPKGLWEAFNFVTHARDHVRYGTGKPETLAFSRGDEKAAVFLDRAAEHLGWLLKTAGVELYPREQAQA